MAAADMKLTAEMLALEARVEPFEMKAQALLQEMLPKPDDASQHMRALLRIVVGSAIENKGMREKLVTMLDDFSGIGERVPDLERRIAELEARRHGG